MLKKEKDKKERKQNIDKYKTRLKNKNKASSKSQTLISNGGVQQLGSEFSVLRHHFFNRGCALTQRVKITPVKVKRDVMSPLLLRLAGSPFSTSFPPPKGINHDRINLPRLEKRRQSLLLRRVFFIVDRRFSWLSYDIFRSIPPLRPTKINAREPVIT